MTDISMQENLRRLIDHKDLSMRGSSIDAGLSPGTVEAILRNPSANPRLGTLRALSKRLGVSVAQLIGDDAFDLADVSPGTVQDKAA